MKKLKIKLNLAKSKPNVLTFRVIYATLISGYTGIVVYFAGHKSITPQGKEARSNKKQKQSVLANLASKLRLENGLDAPYQLLAGSNDLVGTRSSELTTATKAEQLELVTNTKIISNSILMAFLLFVKTFFACPIGTKNIFAKRSRLYRKNKNKKCKDEILICPIKKYDSRILQATRHLARNRSQQNYCYSVGGKRFDSQGEKRQSGMAMLYQRPSGSNYPTGSGDKLFQHWSRKLSGRELRNTSQHWFSTRASLAFLSFFNFNFNQQHVLSETTINYYHSLEKISNEVYGFTTRLRSIKL